MAKRSRLRQPLVGRVREQVSHRAEVCFACDEPGRDLLRDEAVGLLRELIRLDTVNPPGNETRAAELLLADYLGESGVSAEALCEGAERRHLVARIPGRGDGPRLALLSHTDTVLADPAEWRGRSLVGRRAGRGDLGRGALDMKGEVAASASRSPRWRARASSRRAT